MGRRILMRALAGWVLTALLVTGFVGVASSQDEPQTRASLVGLEGVRVYVEELKPEIEAEGLTSGSLEQDAREELKAGGVPLLSEGIQGSGEPYLYVYLHVFRLPTQTRRYLFYIRVELNQQVALQRDPRIVGPAVTWSDGGVGLDFSLENIRGIVRQQVRKFARAYSMANPKRSTSP